MVGGTELRITRTVASLRREDAGVGKRCVRTGCGVGEALVERRFGKGPNGRFLQLRAVLPFF